MLAVERQKKITDILNEREFVTVDELSKELGVSVMTVRRDLEKCERAGSLQRCFGGATLKDSFRNETAFIEKAKQNVEAKARISRYAAGLIKNNDTVFLGAGTTVKMMMDHMTACTGLTVVTDDLNIALDAGKRLNARIIILGGMLMNELGCTVGYFSEEQIRSIHVDSAFLGGLAINRRFDLYSQHESKIALRRLIIENSNQSYLLVDASKFFKTSMYLLNGLENYTGVITDKRFTDEEQQFVLKRGIKFIQV